MSRGVKKTKENVKEGAYLKGGYDGTTTRNQNLKEKGTADLKKSGITVFATGNLSRNSGKEGNLEEQKGIGKGEDQGTLKEPQPHN